MISTVIFDLDGLLADTERLHCRAYQMALLEQGVELDETDYCEHWVRFGKGIADWVTLQKLDLEPSFASPAQSRTLFGSLDFIAPPDGRRARGLPKHSR